MSDRPFTLDSVPYAPKEMIIRNKKGVYLILDPDTPNWIIVDAVGKDIITLCDGTRSVEEITGILCQKYDEPYTESVDHVLDFINEAKRNIFLRKNPFQPPKRAEKEKAPLVTLWLNVTNACNLRCVHCHVSSGMPFKNEMTTQEMVHIIDEASELGLKELVISGGEPLVRSDILDIVDYAAQHIDKVTVITNGTLITDEIAETLSKLDTEIQVSLDGARKETHESIRGRGTYQKTIEGIRKLVKAGARCRTAMTIMKRNMDEMYEIAELSKSMGVNVLHFPVLQNKGRAKNIQSEDGLEEEDYVTIFKRLQKISTRANIYVTTEEAFHSKVEKVSKIDLCGAGSSIISIAADGKVYPCPGCHEEEFCAGNIREQSLENIWRTSEIFKKFRSLSVLDIEECRACELKFICGSGCLVEKYHAYGRLDTPSIRCNAERRIYWYLLSEKIKEATKGL